MALQDIKPVALPKPPSTPSLDTPIPTETKWESATLDPANEEKVQWGRLPAKPPSQDYLKLMGGQGFMRHLPDTKEDRIVAWKSGQVPLSALNRLEQHEAQTGEGGYDWLNRLQWEANIRGKERWGQLASDTQARLFSEVDADGNAIPDQDRLHNFMIRQEKQRVRKENWFEEEYGWSIEDAIAFGREEGPKWENFQRMKGWMDAVQQLSFLESAQEKVDKAEDVLWSIANPTAQAYMDPDSYAQFAYNRAEIDRFRMGGQPLQVDVQAYLNERGLLNHQVPINADTFPELVRDGILQVNQVMDADEALLWGYSIAEGQQLRIDTTQEYSLSIIEADGKEYPVPLLDVRDWDPSKSMTFSGEEALELFEFPEDSPFNSKWQLTIYPDETQEGGFGQIMVDPMGNEYNSNGNQKLDGVDYTPEQVDEMIAEAENIEAVKYNLLDDFRNVLKEEGHLQGVTTSDIGYWGYHPTKDEGKADTPPPTTILLRTTEDFDALFRGMPEMFFDLLSKVGRTEDTETLLKGIGWTDDEIAGFFHEYYQWQMNEITVPFLGWELPFPDTTIDKTLQYLVGGTGGTGGILQPLKAIDWAWTWGVTTLLAIADYGSVGGGYGGKIPLDEQGRIIESDNAKRYLTEMGQAIENYGNSGFFYSAEMHRAVDRYYEDGGAPWMRELVPWTNPLWFISGTSLTLSLAQMTRKVAVVGPLSNILYKSVAFTEAGMAEAMIFPVRWGSKIGGAPIRLVGRKLLPAGKVAETHSNVVTEALTNPEFRAALTREADLDADYFPTSNGFPTYEVWAAHALEGHVHTVTQKAMNTRFGAIPRKTAGLVDGRLVTQTTIDGLKLWHEDMIRQARFMAGQVGPALKHTIMPTTKGRAAKQALLLPDLEREFFGVGKGGIIKKGYPGEGMNINNLMQEGLNVPGMSQQGRNYIIAHHTINDEIVAWAEHFGVPTTKMEVAEGSHYAHRLVLERLKEDLAYLSASNPGKKRHIPDEVLNDYEKLMDYMLVYETHPSRALAHLVEFKMRQVADKVFADEIAKQYDVILPKSDGYNAAVKALNIAKQGGQATKKQIEAFKVEFPELGHRFEIATRAPTVAEQNFRKRISNLLRDVDNLQNQITELGRYVPLSKMPSRKLSDVQLQEMFAVIHYEDRMIFRNALVEAKAKIEEALAQQAEAAAGITDFLLTDPVAQFSRPYTTAGGKKLTLHLDDLLTPEGDWPELLTMKQAKIIMGDSPVLPTSISKAKGRPDKVKWETILDHIAGSEQFRHFTEQQLIDAIQSFRNMKLTLKDLTVIEKDVLARTQFIDDLTRNLDAVNLESQNLPKTTDGLTYDSPQKAGGEVPYNKEMTDAAVADVARQRAGGEIPTEALILTSPEVPVKPTPIRSSYFHGTDRPGDIKSILDEGLRPGSSMSKSTGMATEEPIILQYGKVPGTKAVKHRPGDYVAHEGAQKPEAIYIVSERYSPSGEFDGRYFGGPQEVIDEVLAVSGDIPVYTLTTDFAVGGEGNLLWRQAKLVGGKAPTKPRHAIPEYWTAAQRKAELVDIGKDLRDSRTIKMAEKIPEGYQGVTPMGMGKQFRGWLMPDEVAFAINSKIAEHGNSILEFFANVAGISRGQQAIMDFSVLFMQILPAGGLKLAHGALKGRPDVKGMATYLFAWEKAIKGLVAPETHAAWQGSPQVFRSNMERMSNGGASTITDWFEVMPQLDKLVSKIPGGSYMLRQSFGRFEAQFAFTIDFMRQQTWEALKPGAIHRGGGAELRSLAELCDSMVGVSQYHGVSMMWQQFERAFVFFAPRYRRACLKLITEVFEGRFTAWLAIEALTGMAAGGIAMYTMACKLSGQEVHLDPRDPDFLGFDVGGTRFRLGGVFVGLGKLAGQIFNALDTDYPYTQPIDLMTLLSQGGLNRNNPELMWLLSGSSALTGFIVGLWSHRDFLGHALEDPADYAWYTASHLIPIAMQGVFDAIAWDEEMPGALRLFGDEMGLNARPQTSNQKFNEAVDLAIPNMTLDELLSDQVDKQKAGELHWSDLGPGQQGELLLKVPGLSDLAETASIDSLRYKQPYYQDWAAAVASYDFNQQTGFDEIEADWKKGITFQGLKGGELYRFSYNNIKKTHGISMSLLRENDKYNEVYADFDNYTRTGEGEAGQRWCAYEEFMADIVGGGFDTNKGYDYESYNVALLDFIDRWGSDVYESILTSIEANLIGGNELAIHLWKDRKSLLPYWNLIWQPIYQLPEDEVPDEYLPLWTIHDGLATDAEKQAFRDDWPVLATDWRAEYRAANPQADAALYFWGYSGNLQSKAAYDIAVKTAQDFGISVDNIGRENYVVIPAYIDRQIEFANIEGDLNRKRWLANDKDYYNNIYLTGMDRGGEPREPINFLIIPTKIEEDLIASYFAAPEGEGRKALRCRNQVLDNALQRTGNTDKRIWGTAECQAYQDIPGNVPGAGQATAGFYELP